jgi:hypothetical protein
MIGAAAETAIGRMMVVEAEETGIGGRKIGVKV